MATAGRRPGAPPFDFAYSPDFASCTGGASGSSVGFGSPRKVNFSDSSSPSMSTTTISPGLELAVENLLRQHVLDLPLDRAAQRPGAERRVVALLRQQRLRRGRELQAHVLVAQLHVDPREHEIDDLDDLVPAQLVEDDDVVDAVEELGPEVLLEFVLTLSFIRS